MGQGLTPTAYALLGLLTFDHDVPDAGEGLTGYELKQRADTTLRFYWVSPATSQIYTELGRMLQRGLVDADVRPGRRTTRRYRVTPKGIAELYEWLSSGGADFPVLKHPVALRLLMGHLTGPGPMRILLEDYLDQLAARSHDLEAVRAGLGDDDRLRYPAMVADWGLAYYRDEERTVRALLDRLAW